MQRKNLKRHTFSRNSLFLKKLHEKNVKAKRQSYISNKHKNRNLRVILSFLLLRNVKNYRLSSITIIYINTKFALKLLSMQLILYKENNPCSMFKNTFHLTCSHFHYCLQHAQFSLFFWCAKNDNEKSRIGFLGHQVSWERNRIFKISVVIKIKKSMIV